MAVSLFVICSLCLTFVFSFRYKTPIFARSRCLSSLCLLPRPRLLFYPIFTESWDPRTRMVDLLPMIAQFPNLTFLTTLRLSLSISRSLEFEVTFGLFPVKCESQMLLLSSRPMHPHYRLTSVQHHFSS
ncbi:hypothetical protein ARMGADRAFT_1167899 [Armillaria gallica]|uniref:Uncharacterized protein n=1 Tax=Armillaria gallica TaxID=47427 RepID=A0A2H3D0B3_ARMGA|nr:hypothetical protein ARMGADRAFT_1167899 [Armillaria gallica]